MLCILDLQLYQSECRRLTQHLLEDQGRSESRYLRPDRKVSVLTPPCSAVANKTTSSGKSSLVASILRLLELETGTITIDGTDLSTVPRDIIRERLVTLPQDPLVLIGTVRTNTDPAGSAADTTLVAALERVGLWTTLQERGGLDAEITTASLSRGQQQLLALARALVRLRAGGGGGRVLLLDEPTSNIDTDTDATVQRVVREEFVDCTVLTVAHRMSSILDSDVVVVLEEGKVVEFGTPEDLLSLDGRFARLVKG